MLKQLNILFVLLFGCCFTPAALSDNLDAVKFNRPVIDLANMINEQDKLQIEHTLYQLNTTTGTQIGVVTLNSLDGDAIEPVSMKIAEKWQLGDRKGDKGVLVTIAKTERKVRIEVGQGLEGDLPDAYANRIIDQTITPYFKKGDYGTGIKQGIQQIIAKTNPEFLATNRLTNNDRPEERKTSPLSPIGKIFTLLFVLFLIFTPMGRAILMYMLLSGGRGGRSGGWGGGGGGGYSGGGGGFSGGGASGGW